MAKKHGMGFAALLAGVAAGAAAVFLSKKENRVKTRKVIQKVEKQAVAVAKEAKKNPKKFAKNIEKQGRSTAQKVAKEVKKEVASLEKNAVKIASQSPVLKKVGKTLRKKA